MVTQKPPSWEAQTTPQISQVTLPPCHGNDFLADPKNCNQYYLCNQGKLKLSSHVSGIITERGVRNEHCFSN